MTIKSFASGMFGKLKKYFPKKNFGAKSKILRVKNMKKNFFVDIPHQYMFLSILYNHIWVAQGKKIKKYAQKWDLKRVLARRKILNKSYFISNHNSNMRFV